MERLLQNKKIWKQLPDGRHYCSIQNALMALGLEELKDYDLRTIEGDRFTFMVNLAIKELNALVRARKVKVEGFCIIPTTQQIDFSLCEEKSIIDRYKLPSKPRIKGIKYELSYVSDLELNKKHKNLLWRLSKLPFLVNKEDCNINPRAKEENPLYNIETSIFKTLAKNESEVIKIPHFFDKRGRFYSDSYGLNYQGDEWSKSSISPNYFRRVKDEKAMNWLKIDIANHYGLDKETNRVKLTWFKYVSTKRIAALLAAMYSKGSLYKTADKPLLFKRAIKAYWQAKKGEQINHFVSLDATASGMQILGLMSKDKVICRMTNLTHPDRCYDIYEKIAREVAKYIKLPYSKMIRKYCKKATMTYFYNSQKGLVEQSELINNLGGSVKLTASKLESIISSLGRVAKKGEKLDNNGARLVKDEINKLFHKLPKTCEVIRFTMPDGFKVELPLIVKAMRQFRVQYKNINFMYDVLGNDGSNWRGLVPNIIHAIDSWIAREMVYRAKFPIYCIHDCFYCHPNNVDEMKANMYEILREGANKDFFNYICKQICENAGIEFKPIDFGKENIIISPKAYFIC